MFKLGDIERRTIRVFDGNVQPKQMFSEYDTETIRMLTEIINVENVSWLLNSDNGVIDRKIDIDFNQYNPVSTLKLIFLFAQKYKDFCVKTLDQFKAHRAHTDLIVLFKLVYMFTDNQQINSYVRDMVFSRKSQFDLTKCMHLLDYQFSQIEYATTMRKFDRQFPGILPAAELYNTNGNQKVTDRKYYMMETPKSGMVRIIDHFVRSNKLNDFIHCAEKFGGFTCIDIIVEVLLTKRYCFERSGDYRPTINSTFDHIKCLAENIDFYANSNGDMDNIRNNILKYTKEIRDIIDTVDKFEIK